MQITKPNEVQIDHIAGEVNTIQAGIDQTSMPFLFEMMSKTLYSNPIGSIVREITSNCFDSHKEAGVDDAVVITKGRDDEGDFISFKDFGVGLSTERIQNVYMKYFSSTKRDTNEQIGGFGLGSKTPLSYTDYFYINTTHEGKHYQYVLSKGEQLPTLNLLSESETTDRNGTEIRIYIKSSGDIDRFRTELKKQLCYFDNVYFENWSIDNDYKIYEGQYFKYRSKDHYDKYMHIVFGKVSYPIDWKTINIPEVNIAVGVKFEIGELIITPNREALRYTDEIVVLVRDRIQSAIEELVEMYGDENTSYNSYFGWYKRKNEHAFVTFGTDKCFLYGVKEVERKQLYKHFEGIESIKEGHDVLNLFFKHIGTVRQHKLDKKYGQITSLTSSISNGSNWYMSDTHYTNADKDWLIGNGAILYPRMALREILSKQNLYGSVSVKTSTNGYDKQLTKYFNLGWSLKVYKLMKALREEVGERIGVYRSLTTQEQQDFKDWKQRNDSTLQRRLSGKVFVKSISQNDEYDWQVKHIHGCTGLVIYGFRDDMKKMQSAMKLVAQVRPRWIDRHERFNPKIIRFILINKQNEKYFKHKKNMIHVSKLYGDNALFRTMASAYKVRLFFKEIEDANAFIRLMKDVNPEVGNILAKLKEFYVKNTDNVPIYNEGYNSVDGMESAIMEVANKHNLFDPIIEGMFKSIDKYFEGVEFIRYIEVTDKTVPYILKALYDNKKRMDVSYYQNVMSNESHKQLIFDFDKADQQVLTRFQVGTQLVA